jgi:type III restriction enzyme
VANIGSATDIEQLLGRVLRMPYAQNRANEALNRAYTHVSSPRFGEGAAGAYRHADRENGLRAGRGRRRA